MQTKTRSNGSKTAGGSNGGGITHNRDLCRRLWQKRLGVIEGLLRQIQSIPHSPKVPAAELDLIRELWTMRAMAYVVANDSSEAQQVIHELGGFHGLDRRFRIVVRLSFRHLNSSGDWVL